MEFAGLFVKGVRTSDQFQFVSFYSDGDCALDGFNRDQQILVPALFQNSFQAIQAAASNPYVLSDFQESVEAAWDFLGQELLQIVNLLGRNRNCYSSDTDQSNDAFRMEEFHAQPSGQIEARECVAREQGNIDGLTAIAPAVEFFKQRKECLQTFVLKLSSYFSFKAVSGLNRIPLCRLQAEW